MTVVFATHGLKMPVSSQAPQSRSTDYVENAVGNYDRGVLSVLPDGFGDAEFTFEIYFRPLFNGTYAYGDTSVGGAAQRQLWSNQNPTRYGASDWWFYGNFLVDGHMNAGSNFQNGTFSLQIAAGRPRWTFGDGAAAGANTGSLWGIQSSATQTILQNAWNKVSCVRRFTGGSSSDLELWLNASLQDTQTSSSRTNMATTYWDNWTGYAAGQQNWMFGTEKQAALGIFSQWEDFKGQIGEVRFWSVARSAGALGTAIAADTVVGNESGLVGLYRWNEQTGAAAASSLSGGNISLVNGVTWNPAGPF